MKYLSKTSSILRALLFPPRCAACGELLHPCSSEAEALCPLCRAAWETSTAEAAGSAAEDAARGLIYLTFYRSGHANGVPEGLIYHIKRRGSARSFRFIAGRLAPRVQAALASLPRRESQGDEERPVLFTYPPRRRSAVKREGFDQAERLARALAAACGGQCVSLIRRTRRAAREQKELDATGRAENALLSYELSHPEAAADTLRGRTVVICDDIYTTGATLNRCAHLLVEAGAALVILATVAKNHSEGRRQNPSTTRKET